MSILFKCRWRYYLFLILVVFLGSSAICQGESNVQAQKTTNKQFQKSIDSLNTRITLLTDSLQKSQSEHQALVIEELRKQRERLIELLSTSTSISTSNVGNTISFIALIFSILGFVLLVMTFAGKYYLKNYLERIKNDYDAKFSKKTIEMDLSLEESRANVYLSIGQYKLACDSFEKILATDPENYFAHEKLGVIYLGDILGNPEKAIFHNMEAIRLKTNELLPYVNLQIALDHANHPFEEQEAAFKKAIEMCKLHDCDEMVKGKIKLFFADKIKMLRPERKDEAKQLYREAIKHFKSIKTIERVPEKQQWLAQAERHLKEITIV